MDKSSPVPKFALKLSWNTNLCADASNNIVLLPAATRVTSSAKFAVPSTSTVSRFAVPSTSISALRSILPVIPSVDPSNVRFASPFKLVPLPPVITRLSALFPIDTCVGRLVKF